MLQIKEFTPTPSIVFTFKFAFESFKEFGGVSCMDKEEYDKKKLALGLDDEEIWLEHR
jgi:hypothetical protein